MKNPYGLHTRYDSLLLIIYFGSILDYDLSDEEQEPQLDIEIKSGLLRFWFSSPRLNSKKPPQLICEFPLFIYDDMPRELIKMNYGTKTWEPYKRLRKLRISPLASEKFGTMKKIDAAHKIRLDVLNNYGFQKHSEGTPDYNQDRDGDIEEYDPNDGFSGYKNDYFTIQIKEYLDE